MKLRPFELSLVIIFVVLGLVAVFAISSYSPASDAPEDGVVVGQVVIWGTLPQAAIETVLQTLEDQNEQFRNVTYRYQNPANFTVCSPMHWQTEQGRTWCWCLMSDW